MRQGVKERQKGCDGCQERRVKEQPSFLCNKDRVKSNKGKQYKEEGSRIFVLI